MRTFRTNLDGISLHVERLTFMKRTVRRGCLLLLGMVISSLPGSSCPASALEPTLARLAFRVPPERMEEFATAYVEQIAPVLEKHGLAASSARGRATADSVFSRLFAFTSPTERVAAERALDSDGKWQEVLRELGAAFTPGDELRWQLCVYRTLSGPGRTVEAGPGTRKGAWQSFGLKDGFPVSATLHMLQDRQHRLWGEG